MTLRTLPLPAVLIVVIQSFWIVFDENVTSQVHHAIPRPYVPPTNSSPVSPFYSAPYDIYNGPTRVFPKFPTDNKVPCRPLMSEVEFNSLTSANTGLFLLNQQEIASRTLSGIASRIARNVAARQYSQQIEPNRTACTTRMMPMKGKRLKLRVREQSFLWSMVREPVARMIGKFYHVAVSLDGKEPTLRNFKSFVERNAMYEYGSYFKTLTMRRHLNPYRTDLHSMYTREILEAYDYIAVMERFDESLAVLQLLLGLETQDVLYLPVRSSGAYGGASYEPTPQKCIKIQPTNVPLPFKEYIYQTYMFEDVFEADVYFYQAANSSLERTIDALGRDNVELAVKRLRWAQQRVQKQCAKEVKFPCTSDGHRQETSQCFFADVGCGYKCLDKVGQSLAENQDFLRLGSDES